MLKVNNDVPFLITNMISVSYVYYFFRDLMCYRGRVVSGGRVVVRSVIDVLTVERYMG